MSRRELAHRTVFLGPKLSMLREVFKASVQVDELRRRIEDPKANIASLAGYKTPG